MSIITLPDSPLENLCVSSFILDDVREKIDCISLENTLIRKHKIFKLDRAILE